jgi:Domain of unknown function (DUF4430)
MTPARCFAAVAALAVAAAGCGVGPGESSEGEATLTVTRDYGEMAMREATVADPSASETVILFLDREAEITTRFGGAFVHSIDGVEGGVSGGRSSDWFFFVNGIESSTGAAEVVVRGGDRIWWDYRDWTDALRTPAVVGSWPEPFAQASTPDDEREDVIVECLGATPPCDAVSEALETEGVQPIERASADAPRVLVGPWERVRTDPAAAQIEAGPATSGVFARFERSGDGYRLIGLDRHAEPASEADSGAGLVAAVRHRDEPPTWVVTGVDAQGAERAAELFGSDELDDRYAVAALGELVTGLPAVGVVD